MNIPYLSGDIKVNFNAKWVVSKTEKHFIEHEGHHGLTPEQLKEVYQLCKAAVKPSK